MTTEFPIGRSTLLRLRRRGKIGGERFGREIVFLRSQIEAYLRGELLPPPVALAVRRLPPVPRTIRR